MNTDGSGFTNLHTFTALNNLTNADGIQPFGSLFLSGNTLYLVTHFGGAGANGTIVSLLLPSPPPLDISLSGANAILSWPADAEGFVLQSATSLSPDASWTPVVATPVINDGRFTVTISPTDGQRFYRLAQ